jgi:hypothetical protein
MTIRLVRPTGANEDLITVLEMLFGVELVSQE